jgi:O-antigen/teichoic acid export membrane protein
MMQQLKPKSEFKNNVLTLITGATIAQLIPVLISPILTRIYTPHDFGIAALFIAISSIFGSIANGRYEMAIVLPEKDEDAINIFALGFIITSFISLLLLILVIFLNGYLTRLLGSEDISFWLYLLPASVFLLGLFNILNYFNNRKNNYKDMSNAVIVKSLSLSVSQVSIGFIKNGADGLIYGHLLSQFLGNARLFFNINKSKLLLNVSKSRLAKVGAQYKRFPIYSAPSILANILSRNLISILIPVLHGVGILGFYSLAQRVLGVPLMVIGNSIGQVLLKEASEEKKRCGVAIKSFNYALSRLLVIGMLMLVFLLFYIEEIFAFVFGEEWRIAGIYAKIMVPLFTIRFVVSSLSVVLAVFERQKVELFISVVFVITSIVLINLVDDFINFLEYFNMIMTIEYFLVLMYLFKLSKVGK